jgi:hypothetical protein
LFLPARLEEHEALSAQVTRMHLGYLAPTLEERLAQEVDVNGMAQPASQPHVEEGDCRRKRPQALGLISYPPLQDGGPREKGVLVYIKASLSGDENDYIMAYKAAHESFPHETTLDQFFSEEQVEVYRALVSTSPGVSSMVAIQWPDQRSSGRNCCKLCARRSRRQHQFRAVCAAPFLLSNE